MGAPRMCMRMCMRHDHDYYISICIKAVEPKGDYVPHHA